MGDCPSGFWPNSLIANRPISLGAPSPAPSPPAISVAAAVSGGGISSQSSLVKSSVYKSRLCVFHAAGRCSHGSACSFAHSAYELSDPKTVICPKLEQFGFCDELVFAASSPSSPPCPFAHDASELRQLPKVVKTALCRYYPQGRCKAGSACRHAHSIEEIDPANLSSLYTPETAGLTSLYLSMGTSGSSSPMPPLTTPSPMPSPLGSPRMHSVPISVHKAMTDMTPSAGDLSGGGELDLQSLQASLLALALELERMRTRGSG
jgi:hypothetical protein